MTFYPDYKIRMRLMDGSSLRRDQIDEFIGLIEDTDIEDTVFSWFTGFSTSREHDEMYAKIDANILRSLTRGQILVRPDFQEDEL